MGTSKQRDINKKGANIETYGSNKRALETKHRQVMSNSDEFKGSLGNPAQRKDVP